MEKIPTVFIRDPQDRRFVTDQPHPDAAWVFAGEGVATRKFDGTCVMLDDAGEWWARREVKPNRQAPAGWQQLDHDDVTGKSVGWEPAEQSPFRSFLAEALRDAPDLLPGTYELVGPKINRNPERRDVHTLVSHDRADVLDDIPRDFAGLSKRLLELEGEIEGVVWHHPDGRMAKLKVRDVRSTVSAE